MPLVLVVDDDEDVRDALTDIVKLLGREVLSVEDGEQALTALRNISRPCLILLDLVMPRMDGWRFLAELRADAALAGIPVVVISAHAGSHPPEGADGLIPKPIDLSLLRSTVNEHCPNP